MTNEFQPKFILTNKKKSQIRKSKINYIKISMKSREITT